MKALVKAKPERGIWMKEVAIPEYGVNDVLIAIKKTAICGTDIHILQLGQVGTSNDSRADDCWP